MCSIIYMNLKCSKKRSNKCNLNVEIKCEKSEVKVQILVCKLYSIFDFFYLK